MTILTSVQAYREEFLEVPNSWDDIAQITPVMTDNGIATGALTTPITTPNGGHFQIHFLKKTLTQYMTTICKNKVSSRFGRL